MKKLLFLSFATLAALVGCSKNDDNTDTEEKDYVYISGIYHNRFTNTDTYCYWVDGERFDLAPLSGNYSSFAFSTDDIYSTGTFYKPGHNTAFYSRNFSFTELDVPLGTDSASGILIAVSGGRVYVAGGHFGSEPSFCYWVDGERFDLALPQGSTANYFLHSIAVSDGKVYVAGDYRPTRYYPFGGYWVDGVYTEMTAPGVVSSSCNSIVVSDGHVYITGECVVNGVGSIACYWIDGNLVRILDKAEKGAICESIAVSDSRVYTAGKSWVGDTFAPCYWIDGVHHALSLPPAASPNVELSIAVSENKVYVAGGYYEDSGKQTACYWVDGERIDLNVNETLNARALSIAVVRK